MFASLWAEFTGAFSLVPAGGA